MVPPFGAFSGVNLSFMRSASTPLYDLPESLLEEVGIVLFGTLTGPVPVSKLFVVKDLSGRSNFLVEKESGRANERVEKELSEF